MCHNEKRALTSCIDASDPPVFPCTVQLESAVLLLTESIDSVETIGD